MSHARTVNSDKKCIRRVTKPAKCEWRDVRPIASQKPLIFYESNMVYINWHCIEQPCYGQKIGEASAITHAATENYQDSVSSAKERNATMHLGL